MVLISIACSAAVAVAAAAASSATQIASSLDVAQRSPALLTMGLPVDLLELPPPHSVLYELGSPFVIVAPAPISSSSCSAVPVAAVCAPLGGVDVVVEVVKEWILVVGKGIVGEMGKVLVVIDGWLAAAVAAAWSERLPCTWTYPALAKQLVQLLSYFLQLQRAHPISRSVARLCTWF